MPSFSNQVRQVFRRLRRTPMFTAVTLATLAVGVGANTAIFSVVEGILLKPLPYSQPDRLVAVRHTAPGIGIAELPVAPANYFIYREQNRAIQDMGVYTGDSVNVTGLAEPEQIHALDVSEGLLPVLGVQPFMGRSFTSKDDIPGSPDTVMLSYGYWQRKFGGDPNILGRRIMIDSKAHSVIGVLPKAFRFLGDDAPALLLPLQFDRNKLVLGNFSYQAIARLKPTATAAQVSAEIVRLLPVVNSNFPPPPGFSVKMFEQARIAPIVKPLKQQVVGDIGNVLWVLMGTIGIVLLIACANVANLLLVRAEGRQQELAIRAALGAGWMQIAGELLLESLVLGVAGCVFGLGLAYAGLRAVIALAPAGLPRLHEIGLDLPVVLFAIGISLAASLLFGAVPVLKYAGTQLGAGLRDGGRTLGQTRERHRARATLVMVQVSLAVVLLIGSGLMIRTFRALTRVDPGFAHAAQVETLRIAIPEADVPEAERVTRMQQEILRKISVIPGVSSAGLISTLPMDGDGSFDAVFAQDQTYPEGTLPPVCRYKFISPGVLSTLGTPLIAGRDFTWDDLYQRRPVAMVSEAVARQYWHDPSAALGKHIRDSLKNDWREVVAVVKDVRDDGVDQKVSSSVYWPILMNNFWGEKVQVRRTLAVAIRSPRAGSEGFLNDVRRSVWSVNPNVPLANVSTLEEIYRKSMARTSFTLVMLAAASAMALLLGIVGIYGVIAYSVSQRRREIGIRMALGARQSELAGMFVRHGVLLAACGIVCGLAGAVALTRLMTKLLFEVSPVDPLTYGLVVAGLVTTAALASYVPSRRAAAVDPSQALRAE
jgi:putative ABC transport system permease protein